MLFDNIMNSYILIIAPIHCFAKLYSGSTKSAVPLPSAYKLRITSVKPPTTSVLRSEHSIDATSCHPSEVRHIK